MAKKCVFFAHIEFEHPVFLRNSDRSSVRKAAFIATWLFFWLATLVLYFYNKAEFDSSSEVEWNFGTILNLFGLIFWDFVIVAFSL